MSIDQSAVAAPVAGRVGRPPAAALTAVGAAALAILLVRLTPLGTLPATETFVLVFTSIVVEALPFILLGALVSAVIEVYVPDRTFERLARLPSALQIPGAALGGLAFPVCECGSVPVARRLITRGMHPGAGLAFMLAAPILNPIVILSTVVAYGGRDLALEMAAGRVLLGLALAVVAGWALGNVRPGDLLRERDDAPACDHDEGSRSRFVEHLAGDFFHMGRFVILGAGLAALLQTAIPQSLVSGVARTPVIGSLALMGIAFVLSLCSEADAFVAVSFTPFPIGSQLAFLVFGPVVDAKLAFLYGATFRRRFVLRLLAVAVPVVLAGSLWFEVLLG
ncbi:MAG TPA: permease [Actinomycetota bacterium]|nr:permease [Actinomycetota bacterium]